MKTWNSPALPGLPGRPGCPGCPGIVRGVLSVRFVLCPVSPVRHVCPDRPLCLLCLLIAPQSSLLHSVVPNHSNRTLLFVSHSLRRIARFSCDDFSANFCVKFSVIFSFFNGIAIEVGMARGRVRKIWGDFLTLPQAIPTSIPIP